MVAPEAGLHHGKAGVCGQRGDGKPGLPGVGPVLAIEHHDKIARGERQPDIAGRGLVCGLPGGTSTMRQCGGAGARAASMVAVSPSSNRMMTSRSRAGYQDGAGSICLWVRSDLERGGCAISASAIEWLDGMPGAHFIRLTNERGRLDVVMPMDQVPMGEAREGRHGRYFIVDPDDLTGPPFPPLRDFGEGVPF